MAGCTIADCPQDLYARGMCEMHYRRVLRTGDPGPAGVITRTKGTCSADGCAEEAEAKGFCHGHYQHLLRTGVADTSPLRKRGRLCAVFGCDRPHKALGYCQAHYKRLISTGDVEPDRPVRQVAGDGYSDHGYWVIPVPPNLRWLVGGATRIGEHRLVMALHLGRAIRPDEVIHHRNGDRSDNRIVNLELWSVAHPSGQRVEDVVAFSIEMLARYAPEIGSWAAGRTGASQLISTS